MHRNKVLVSQPDSSLCVSCFSSSVCTLNVCHIVPKIITSWLTFSNDLLQMREVFRFRFFICLSWGNLKTQVDPNLVVFRWNLLLKRLCSKSDLKLKHLSCWSALKQDPKCGFKLLSSASTWPLTPVWVRQVAHGNMLCDTIAALLVILKSLCLCKES